LPCKITVGTNLLCYEEQFNLIFIRDSLILSYYDLLVAVG